MTSTSSQAWLASVLEGAPPPRRPPPPRPRPGLVRLDDGGRRTLAEAHEGVAGSLSWPPSDSWCE